MSDKLIEGQPFPNSLNRQMSTMWVLHKEFDGECMLINSETFNPAVHTRCNELGQPIDEKGRLVEVRDKEAVNKAKEEKAGK